MYQRHLERTETGREIATGLRNYADEEWDKVRESDVRRLCDDGNLEDDYDLPIRNGSGFKVTFGLFVGIQPKASSAAIFDDYCFDDDWLDRDLLDGTVEDDYWDNPT